MECFTKFCVCLIFLIVTIHGVSAALLDVCGNGKLCTATGGDPNAVCSTDVSIGGDGNGNCICTGTFKNNTKNDSCVAKGILEITCTPGDTGNTKCETQDKNTECSAGSTTCTCKADHFLTADKKQCVQSIEEITCTTGNTGNTKCETQAKNAECPVGNTCACKAEYFLSSDKKTCKQKVSTVACTPAHATNGDTKCQQVDANSECKTDGTMCGCKKGYTDTDSCTKILGGTCPANGDCSGSVDNSVCTLQMCECGTNFIEENAVCKTALGQACTGTGQGTCVSNAECKDEKCKCSSGFKDTDGLCAAESSATSAWMTTSLLVTSMLIFLPRFICG